MPNFIIFTMLSLHNNTMIITVRLRINWLTTGLTHCECVREYLFTPVHV